MTYLPEDDILEEILIALRDAEVTVREQAMTRLYRYTNTAGSPQSANLTEAEAKEAFENAHQQYLQYGPIVEALVKAIDDPSVPIRAKAVHMLRYVMAPEAQPTLLRHLREDPVESIRTMCVWSLQGSPSSPQKVKGLIDALLDFDSRVASSASCALGRLGDPEAVGPLRAMLSYTDWNVRFSACGALVRLQAVDPSLVALLEELNQQPDAEKHNETVLIARRVWAKRDPNAVTSPTTQEMLDQARRALP